MYGCSSWLPVQTWRAPVLVAVPGLHGVVALGRARSLCSGARVGGADPVAGILAIGTALVIRRTTHFFTESRLRTFRGGTGSAVAGLQRPHDRTDVHPPIVEIKTASRGGYPANP